VGSRASLRNLSRMILWISPNDPPMIESSQFSAWLWVCGQRETTRVAHIPTTSTATVPICHPFDWEDFCPLSENRANCGSYWRRSAMYSLMRPIDMLASKGRSLIGTLVARSRTF